MLDDCERVLLMCQDQVSQSTKSGAMDKLIEKGKDLLTAANPSKAKRQERKEAKMLKSAATWLCFTETGWAVPFRFLPLLPSFPGLGREPTMVLSQR